MKTSLNRLYLGGFLATFIMCVIMYPAFAVSIPTWNFAGFIGSIFAGEAITNSSPFWWLGLLIQVLIGSVLAPMAYRALYSFLFGPPIVRGLLFSGILWVLALAVVTPLMGFGFFGSQFSSPSLLVGSLALVHTIYGLVLGGVTAPRR